MTATVFGLGADYLYGYVGEQRFTIRNTIEQIMAFLMKFDKEPEVMVANVLEMPELIFSNGSLQDCSDYVGFKTELEALMVRVQETGEKLSFVPYVHQQSDGFIVSNVRMKSGGGHYLGALDFEDKFPQPYSRESGYFASEEEVIRCFPDAISWNDACQIAKEKGWL